MTADKKENNRVTVASLIAAYLTTINLAAQLIWINCYFMLRTDLTVAMVISFGLLVLTGCILAFRRWAWIVGAFIFAPFVLYMLLVPVREYCGFLLDEVSRTRHGLSVSACVTNILWYASVLPSYGILYFAPQVRRVFRKGSSSRCTSVFERQKQFPASCLSYYYADQNSLPVGPYTGEQMQRLFQQEMLHENSWVIVEGATEWQSYNSLFPSVPPPTPAR